MTKVFAVSRRPSTSNASGPTNRPLPKMTSTPSPRKRSGLSLGSMPLITPATRSMTLARSGCGGEGASAQRSAWRIAWATCADLRSVFDGTQPYQRQSPPSLCFSTTATLAPSAAPPAATTSPPAPPPITTRSNSGLAILCRRARWANLTQIGSEPAQTGRGTAAVNENRGSGPANHPAAGRDPRAARRSGERPAPRAPPCRRPRAASHRAARDAGGRRRRARRSRWWRRFRLRA